METKQNIISIKSAKEVIGRELCMSLLFAHAMSGCDTTSSLYGIGKIKHIKLLESSQLWRSDVLVFGDTAASTAEVCNTGERFIKSLYSGGANADNGLDELRYLYAISPKYVPVERMPPTKKACDYHCLRVHHQVSTWQHLETVLEKEEFGFRVNDNAVVPIITDMAAAPQELLLYIRCSCRTSRQLCASCSCSKKGIACSVHCKCEAQCQHGPSDVPVHDEGDSE